MGSAQKKTDTNARIEIPGSHLSIVPPAGFQLAAAFMGMQKGEYAGLQVFDVAGGNHYSNSATFTKEAFESKGAKVFEFKETTVNGFAAKYVVMQGEPTAKVIGLVFGDSTFSAMVMANYPATDAVTEADLQQAFKTIQYDKNKKIDPFATAPFTLNDSKSAFKFSKAASGVFIYSVGGVDTELLENQPFVTVTAMPTDNTMTAQTISELFIAKLQEYGLTDKQLKNESATPVNGYNTYEVEVYGTMEGKSSMIYQLVVTEKDKAVIIQGLAQADFSTHLSEIKKLAKTVQLK